MAEIYRKEIVQHITKNLLDIQLLRLVQAQPLWEYKIKKMVEIEFHIKLRHSALYPLLNTLEREGFLTSQTQHQGGRARKVYIITKKAKSTCKAVTIFSRNNLRTKTSNSYFALSNYS